MTNFHPLKVTDIQKTIRDAVVVTLQAENAAEFGFAPGQYLTFKRDFEGEELRRSYSICAAPHEGILQVGIKSVDGGAFSTWANTELQVGDVMDAMPPMGNFHAAVEDDAPHYLAFAGGSGITPVLSILKTALSEDASTRFTLVYANRTPNTIMFREELEDLKNRYLHRLNIVHVLEDDSQDIELFKGRVDQTKCADLFRHWIDIKSVSMAYICGPEPMMLAISQALKDHGLRKDQIRFELFASSQPGRARKRAVSKATETGGVKGRVTLGGETRSLVIPKDTSLLESALAENLDAPHACKAGVCSTCKAKVLEGEVEMVANHALEDYEVEAGFVLTCQCFAVSEKVVWDYDEAGH
ncbi:MULTISPECIES: ferredoxin--NADP reductase [unclassified Ruegeria]|uniref:ferredoxin--NADP reductase n=1 Tax=unclassified Ruegeria TaxID=2625375 RepID=UPI001ADA166A|nr:MULTISPECIES: ferredoxin--NADP reductase [unclassified Ruegeria]MBO9413641.1 ferredoxin--NADP reductase [Ruegeria sp. R8_1]MBO9417627.1 ferredoxin--NADP reductase [Ruegeria sp. R8_2]